MITVWLFSVKYVGRIRPTMFYAIKKNEVCVGEKSVISIIYY